MNNPRVATLRRNKCEYGTGAKRLNKQQPRSSCVVGSVASLPFYIDGYFEHSNFDTKEQRI
jgi:hypothetical protein